MPESDIANGAQARAYIADRVRRVDIGFLSDDQIQDVAQEIIDHLVPPIRRQTAEEIAQTIERVLQKTQEQHGCAALGAAASIACEIGGRDA